MSFSCLGTQALFSFLEAAVLQSYESLLYPDVFFLSAATVFVREVDVLADTAFGHTWCKAKLLSFTFAAFHRCEETISREERVKFAFY